MSFLARLISVTVACLCVGAFGGELLMTAAEVNRYLMSGGGNGNAGFELKVTVLQRCIDSRLLAYDGTGSTELSGNLPELKAGDQITVRGNFSQSGFWGARLKVTNCIPTGHIQPRKARRVTGSEFQSGECDFDVVELHGVIRNAVREEIDPDYLLLLLCCDGVFINAHLRIGRDSSPDCSAMVGAEAKVAGVCMPRYCGFRQHIGRDLQINLSGFEYVPMSDPFAVPDIGELSRRPPMESLTSGRHRLKGHVVAVWGGRNLLVRREKFVYSRVELSSGDKLPAFGDCVEVSGFPEVDPYKLNLVNAVWRGAGETDVDIEYKIEEKSAASLFRDKEGRPRIDYYQMGQGTAVRGIAGVAPTGELEDGIRILSDGYEFVFDPGVHPEMLSAVEEGAEVLVSGTFIAECEGWRPELMVPRISGVRIVARDAKDIRVLKAPSWWTPARFVMAIALLITALIGLVVYNLVQRRASGFETKLRLRERTRLAIELHDSLSQNLTGVSMEVSTARRLAAETGSKECAQHLDSAASAIGSCREELRNCLWDLRNNLLENSDMNDAIRRTLEQKTAGAELQIRFSVPRGMLDDNTAHNILKIIRELAVNAVRHGHATAIRIAGAHDDDIVKFSVQDNGCGFDVENAPGMAQGHFGLQGIRERIEAVEGLFSIESSAGAGTRAVVEFRLPVKEMT